MTLTQYNSGCLRSIVLEQLTGYKTDIDPIYKALGTHHEDLLEARLNSDIAEREFVIKAPITANVIYSGRADFILKDGTILEAKASLAKGKYKQEPLPKASHISQVVSYMLQLKVTLARIVWGHYKAEQTPEGYIFTAIGEADYEVVLSDQGQVVIDGIATEYFAQDQLAHMYRAAEALETGDWESQPLPHNWDSAWQSPCKYCPFRTTHCFKEIVT